jgi:hypothetical protein
VAVDVDGLVNKALLIEVAAGCWVSWTVFVGRTGDRSKIVRRSSQASEPEIRQKGI